MSAVLHVEGRDIGFLDWPAGDSFMPAPLGGTMQLLKR